MAKVAVIFSGCGFLDGAEIREAVLSLLYLDQQGAEVAIFAPDRAQHHAVNHLSGLELPQNRNILEESARIARGKISPLNTLDAADFDALILPGGYGVAKNFCDLAFKGKDATVLPEIKSVIQGFYDLKKPIGAICIAPALVALALPNQGIRLTIGDDDGTAAVIVNSGNLHQIAPTDDVVIDEMHKIVSCSAYMREDRLDLIARGIEKTIEAVFQWVKKN